jgi:predicted nuclease of predicted toxin-antitoxin system
LSSGALPEGGLPRLFIDRDAWSHVLDAALRAAGIPFVAHREVFRPDTPDAEWIAEVGRQGWVVITRDQNIRRRPNELRAVRAAGLHLFALTSGNLSAAETASVIIKAWRSIQQHVAQTPTPPCSRSRATAMCG